MAEHPTPSLDRARAWAVAAAAVAQVAASLSGLLPAWAPVVGVPATAAAMRAAATSRPAAVAGLRRAGTAVAAVAVGATAAIAVLAGPVAAATHLLPATVLVLVAAQALCCTSSRDVRTCLVCVSGLLLLAAAFAPDVVVAPVVLAGWACVLVAALLLPAARLEEDPRPFWLPDAGGGRHRVPWAGPAPALVAVVLALALAPLLPSGTSTPPTLPSAVAGGAGQRPTGPPVDTTAFTSSSLDLSTRIDELSDRPVLDVASDSPPLWRSTVYERYDGRAWTVPDNGGRVFAAPFGAAGPGTREDSVEVLAPTTAVWAPGRVVGVDARLPVAMTPDGDLVAGRPLRRYTVTTLLPEQDEGRLQSAAGPAVDSSRWLQLPDALPQRVRDLAQQITAGARTQRDAVLAVEQHLRSRYTYELDIPVPPQGQDAVDRFLFVDRAGFCQQFAAADAVLLRAVGIPARVVTGLGYGIDRGSRRVYQERHLHAWVEVLYPGIGWVASDATPASDTAASGASVRDRVANALSDAIDRVQDLPGGAAVAVVVAAAVAVGLVQAVRVLRRRRRAPTRDLTGPLRADVRAGPALEAFLRLDAARAPEGRRPAESLREVGARWAVAPDVASAVEVVEQECYAAVPPSAAPAAAEVLDRAAREAARR